ncbi:hypothetical protein GOV04_05730 [Candidatus Woesearchaeota archaeon]|nr:hypothetical protein [Candidatus Woesearchaeota archaeon]
MAKEKRTFDSGEQLNLEQFFSSHSEQELILLRNLLDNLVLQKRKEKELEFSIPLSIFSQQLSPAEALVKFLKDNKGLRFCNIAKALQKKENGVWLNYQRAIKKKSGELTSLPDDIQIPLYIFKNPSLSYLESIVYYLRTELKLSNKLIAKKLSKSEQVLSIAYNRAKNKLKNE